jgi:hypothetical protein
MTPSELAFAGFLCLVQSATKLVITRDSNNNQKYYKVPQVFH